ncbi:glycosyltransferase [Humitalea sp. 24SJ18S-53]|uniref:glycosyltransferase n=1 Tax=Humitalea sp. 24SJ18S-53 TaxID=3422307 RepID=UPI003D67B241
MTQSGLPGVSIMTVAADGLFFVRLLVEQVRATIGARPYEVIVVDRGSRDGLREWARAQPDVRLLTHRVWPWQRGHRHGEAAEYGARHARHDRIVLLDSDAHPMEADWLHRSADLLDAKTRLAGAIFRSPHIGNPHGWYVHPHFMAFLKSDLGGLVVLRKIRGEDTDTGEEATIRVLEAGLGIVGHEIAFCPAFDVGHPRVPTMAGGVFHAWYVSRLTHNEAEVIRETEGQVSRTRYLDPLLARLRAAYGG